MVFFIRGTDMYSLWNESLQCFREKFCPPGQPDELPYPPATFCAARRGARDWHGAFYHLPSKPGKSYHHGKNRSVFISESGTKSSSCIERCTFSTSRRFFRLHKPYLVPDTIFIKRDFIVSHSFSLYGNHGKE